MWGLRGSYFWGLNICVGQEDMKGTDQIVGRISVQDRRTGECTDLTQDAWHKYRGDRGHEEQRGPGVTSGLGGREALRRSSLGS